MAIGDVMTAPAATFGSVFDHARDGVRIGKQMERVFAAIKDHGWHTLPELEEVTGDPPASISAQLRHLRKKSFGSYVIEKRLRGESKGLWEYRLV